MTVKAKVAPVINKKSSSKAAKARTVKAKVAPVTNKKSSSKAGKVTVNVPVWKAAINKMMESSPVKRAIAKAIESGKKVWPEVSPSHPLYAFSDSYNGGGPGSLRGIPSHLFYPAGSEAEEEYRSGSEIESEVEEE